MFGHQDDQNAVQNGIDINPITDTSSQIAPPIQNQDLVSNINLSGSSDLDAPAPESAQTWQHPGEAIQSHVPLPPIHDDVISPAGGYPQPLSDKELITNPIPASNMHVRASVPQDGASLTDATDDDLVDVKDKALDELYPLMDKLDQSPEEHFRTIMMIIQASDNHALIQQAYQIAQTINDEKARAQALLDIINEINYFTQQPEV